MKKKLSLVIAVSVVSGILAQVSVSAAAPIETRTITENFSYSQGTGSTVGTTSYYGSENKFVWQKGDGLDSNVVTAAYGDGYRWVTSKYAPGTYWNDNSASCWIDEKGLNIAEEAYSADVNFIPDTDKKFTHISFTSALQSSGASVALFKTECRMFHGTCLEFGIGQWNNGRTAMDGTGNRTIGAVGTPYLKVSKNQDWDSVEITAEPEVCWGIGNTSYMNSAGDYKVDWDFVIDYEAKTVKYTATRRACGDMPSLTWSGTYNDTQNEIITGAYGFPIAFRSRGHKSAAASFTNLVMDYDEEAWPFADSFTGVGYNTYATSADPVVSSNSEIKTVAEYNNGYKWITSKKLCGVDWESDKLGNAYVDTTGAMTVNTMWGYGTGIYLDTGKTAVKKLKTVKFQASGDLVAVRLAVSEDEGSCFEFGKASRSSQRFFRGNEKSDGTAYVSAIREKAGERQWYKSDFAGYADDYFPDDAPWQSDSIVDW
ncbi:MAG: hypothetical protein PUE13_07260, partial [Clostridiales bacterium]|nr:hypothetical protein [Clostridiales bacterium]